MPRPSHIILGSFLLAATSPLVRAEGNAQSSPVPPPVVSQAAEECASTLVCASPAQAQVERDRLYLENQLREERLRKELSESNAELQRIKTQVDLNRAKADQALADRNLEIQKARLEMEEIN